MRFVPDENIGQFSDQFADPYGEFSDQTVSPSLKSHVIVATDLSGLPQAQHCCTACFQEWDAPPPVDQDGKHTAPDGSRCAGPINCFPTSVGKNQEGS